MGEWCKKTGAVCTGNCAGVGCTDESSDMVIVEVEPVQAASDVTVPAMHMRATIDAVLATHLGPVLAMVQAIGQARERGNMVFVAGNGGSAATASHFAADLQKACQVRALALCDSMPLVTAWANDADYSGAFAGQLWALARDGDVLVVLSCSGTSSNVVRSAREAVKGLPPGARVTVCAVVGTGNAERVHEYADVAIIVPSTDYEVIEDVALVICHAVKKALLDPGCTYGPRQDVEYCHHGE